MSDIIEVAHEYLRKYFPSADISISYDSALRCYMVKYDDGGLDDASAIVGLETAKKSGLGPALLLAIRKELGNAPA